MSENNQKRKILVSEKIYEKISPALKDALVTESFEIEVVSEITPELRTKLKQEKEDILVLEEAKETEYMVLDFKLPPDYIYSDQAFSDKKQKMYVPKTIGKPNNKRKGARNGWGRGR